MEQLINWIYSTTLSGWVIDIIWVAPTAEILHFFGLSILLGSIFIVDLRLAGLFRAIPIEVTHKLIPWAIAGFLINLCSGVLLIFGDPGRYFINIAFQIKMLLVIIAGLNAILFYWKINPLIASWKPDGTPTPLARVIAVASITVWVGVLLMGRLIPYVGTG